MAQCINIHKLAVRHGRSQFTAQKPERQIRIAIHRRQHEISIDRNLTHAKCNVLVDHTQTHPQSRLGNLSGRPRPHEHSLGGSHDRPIDHFAVERKRSDTGRLVVGIRPNEALRPLYGGVVRP